MMESELNMWAVSLLVNSQVRKYDPKMPASWRYTSLLIYYAAFQPQRSRTFHVLHFIYNTSGGDIFRLVDDPTGIWIQNAEMD